MTPTNQTLLEQVALRLDSELSLFTGTTTYYRNWQGLLYTDGVKYLAENAGAYWLIDAIASWQPHVRTVERDFQLWELHVSDNHGAELTVRRDSGAPAIARQKIGCTDFPLRSIILYVQGDVLLLPTEY
jgi:hypothetical protein